MSSYNKKPSNSSQPDLDWSQVRETVRMLFLTVAQIEIAMRESDDSIDHLSNAFTTMVGYEQAISSTAEKLIDHQHNPELVDNIKHNSAQIGSVMREAIIAFQFYDKLAQRLTHVSSSLEGLSELVSDQGRIYNPEEWKKLQANIREKYSMREEREMFDSVMKGDDVREAIRRYNEMHKDDLIEDVEFF